jgi:hypothetical protein
MRSQSTPSQSLTMRPSRLPRCAHQLDVAGDGRGAGKVTGCGGPDHGGVSPIRQLAT